MEKVFKIGSKSFVLDQDKAEEAFAAKRVINGRDTMSFNILPLKYQWAYDLYKTMKTNHWEPEDIPMQKDIEQWQSDDDAHDVERWIIKMGIGYFSAAEGIVGDNILHVVREVVTAPELKLVLGRHAHEENIHADSPALHDQLAGHQPARVRGDVRGRSRPSRRRTTSVTGISRALRRDIDLTDTGEQAGCWRRTSSSSASAWRARSSTASSA